MYQIYPKPAKIYVRDTFISKSQKPRIFFTDRNVNVLFLLAKFTAFDICESQDADIFYRKVDGYKDEAYALKIDDKQIIIEYSQDAGAYYATQTLRQIFAQTNTQIQGVEIYDEPDLAIRGLLLDISRSKIPQLKTIFEIIDLMALLKMNHLELYVEGFSFGYPSFTKYWHDETPITVEEYKKIEEYCNQNFIDLVPNQNGFGHMAPWLALDEFKDLAECPEGIYLWGTHRAPSTLNPLDERSLELISRMYQDMLPISNSKYFNMNFDEPFELGKGKSKEYCEKYGLGNCYVDFVLKAYHEIKKYNKQPLIWGDVLLKHPEVLHRLPDDMIFIDWGYDGNYPFSKNLKMISEKNIKFIAAPGTTSWCSLSGRTSDMLFNIYNACIYTKEYQGLGVLLTDWGDFGHLQYWPVSLVPLSYMGLLSWRVEEGTHLELKHFVNKYVFKDENNLMTDLMLDFGSYNKLESYYPSNGTQTFYTLIWANFALKEEKPLEYFQGKIASHQFSLTQYQLMQNYFSEIIERLKYTKMQREDAQLIKEEIIQSINLLTTIQKVNLSFNENVNISLRKTLLQEVINSSTSLINNHKRLWLQRNRTGGLWRSVEIIENLIKFARLKLQDLVRGEKNEDEICD